MSRLCAWSVHLAVLLVGGTGLVYGWMRYLLEPESEFAVVNHPWEPGLRDGHLITAPLLVFLCGVIWRAHVWARLRSGFRPRRRTGLALVLLLPPMILSGYLLQVAVEERWRTLWIWIHATTSTAWAVLYLWHQVSRRRSVAGGPASRRGSSAVEGMAVQEPMHTGR